MEVEHLAVIQRKCAKCYQNWIRRQQLCSMNKKGRKIGSLQVTHGWNFPTLLQFSFFAMLEEYLVLHCSLSGDKAFFKFLNAFGKKHLEFLCY